MNQKHEGCQHKLMVIRDAVEVIQGKWRMPIVLALSFGNRRFGELQRDIVEISPKMLAQELRALEENKIIIRTVYDTMPVTVEYSLTPLGRSLHKVLDELLKWGAHFREEILGKSRGGRK